MPTNRSLFILYALGAALALLPGAARAAEPKAEMRDFAVRTWTKADGLPNANVTVILQTADGYLWLGTGAGLFRFDGIDFEAIPLAKKSLPITALSEDDRGRLWVGTQNEGIYWWQNGVARHFDQSDGLLDLAITSLSLDNQGRMWIGTRGGVNMDDGHRRFTSYTSKDGLQSDLVLNVQAAPSGTVWITTAGGMCKLVNNKLSQFHFPASDQERDREFLQVYEDRRGSLWAFCDTYLINLAEGKRINYFPGEKSATTRIWSLYEGRNGRLWIGASGRGVFSFDGSKFQPVTLNEGRWPNDVRAICEDHEGDLWLGISGVGLVQLRPQTFALLTESQGLPPGAATCVTLDHAGRVWVGLDSGGLFAGNGDRFEAANAGNEFLGQDVVNALCVSPEGTLWAGTTGTGLYELKNGRAVVHTTADGLMDDDISSLCADAGGAIWIGSPFGTLQRLDRKGLTTFAETNLRRSAAITALLARPDGGLWIGTGAGILIDSPAGGVGTVSMALPKLGNKPILCLCASTNGGTWIGTDGGGLGYWKGDLRHVWDTVDGLPDNTIWGMAEDEEANLWLATPRGICRINSDSIPTALRNAGAIKVKLVYETEAGASRALKSGGPRIARATDGRLWFALSTGLIGVDVQGRDTEKPPPQVHIEAMLVNNAPVSMATTQHNPEVELEETPHTLEFRYTGLSFENPEKVRFRHKLDGFDADWIESATERQAHYGPLPSGEYTFRVTACNAEGIWNQEGASLAFVIPTPFWRESWFLVLATLTATALSAIAVRTISHRRLRWKLRGLEQQQAMERERMRIAQNMHDEIGSKLTKISYLSERARVELRGEGKTESKIDSIAATSHDLLKTLDEIVWAVNPKNDTLEHLAAYLCQYAREYFQDTPIECDLRMQAQLPQVEMSAELRHNLFLTFEETLNNVLKHANATKVSVDISIWADFLRIVIRDNGVGFDRHAKATETKAIGGNGLRNMRQHLADAGGGCSIETAPGQGTSVALSVPLNLAKLPHP